jgi:NitT/TauT family transport system substrate-binding protein
MATLLTRLMLLLCALIGVTINCWAQETIKIGTLGHSLGFLQVDIAEAKGWLNNDQLKTSILTFQAGKDCATALQNGEIDAAILGIDHAITSQQKGISIKQLMLLNRIPGWILIVSTKSAKDIKTPSDLKGRKIGVTAPGSATDILVTYLLSKNGIGAKEFTPVRAGIDTLPEIMRQGGIDAGMALEPHGTQILESGEGVALVDFRSVQQVQQNLGSLYPVTALLVRQDAIERKARAVQQLTTALVWASKWLQTASAEDVQSLLPREYTPNPDLWRKSYGGYKEVFSPDGKNDIEGIRAVIASQIAFGNLKAQSEINVDALHDEAFWTAANQIPVPQGQSPPRSDVVTDQGGLTGKLALGLILLLILSTVIYLIVRGKRSTR